MAKLTRKRYLFGLMVGDEVVEHEVAIAPADLLVAEQEASRHGIEVDKHSMNFATLYLYNAARRLGLYPGKYPAFVADLYEWEIVRDDDGEPVEEIVPPTLEAPRSDSDSGSLPPSPEPASTGSTPASTSD